jgi:hypothetical protein
MLDLNVSEPEVDAQTVIGLDLNVSASEYETDNDDDDDMMCASVLVGLSHGKPILLEPPAKRQCINASCEAIPYEECRDIEQFKAPLTATEFGALQQYPFPTRPGLRQLRGYDRWWLLERGTGHWMHYIAFSPDFKLEWACGIPSKRKVSSDIHICPRCDGTYASFASWKKHLDKDGVHWKPSEP